jgi:L-aminopeptidase/D-esterase-like protein
VAHNGYARAISPIHTTLDGDTIFALATGEIETSIDVVANLASEVMQEAIYSAVKSSKSVLGLKSFNDISYEK